MTQTHRIRSFAFLCFGIMASPVMGGENNPPSGTSPIGFWKTEDQKAIVNIQPCAHDETKLCGKITELQTPIDPETGKPKTDKKNTDDALKNRPLLGLEILSGFSPKKGSKNAWEDGKIYSPTEGKTYDSSMDANGDILNVRGHVFLFYKTQKWTRVTGTETK